MSIRSRLRLALPKPLLFGLYGALGGLLGALVLGEALWAILHPPTAVAVTVPLRVAASPGVEVYQGGSNRFNVKVAREKWDGPVTIMAADIPTGVKVAPATVPAGASDVDVEVTATPDAPAAAINLKLEVQGPPGDALRTAMASLELQVRKRQAPPPELRLSTSPEVVVDQRGSNKFGVAVARDRFEGEITVTVDGLPGGVTAAPVTIPAKASSAEVVLSAGAAAPVGSGVLAVTATGPEGLPGAPGRPTATGRLKVTINKYEPRTAVDIMFVLDETMSMGPEINGVRDGIVDFARELESQNLDARVGLLAFRDRWYGDEPTLIKVDGEVFTKNYAGFREQMNKHIELTNGHDLPESSLDALAEAARQPFRAEANRVLILITDDQPKVPDVEMKSVDQAIDVLREHRINQLHLVVPPRFNAKFTPLQKTCAGRIFDVEVAASDRTAFARLMPEVSKAIAKLAIESQKPAPPPAAAEAPALPPPKARAAGELPSAAAPAVLRGVQSEQVFAASSGGRLLVAIGVWTAAIAAMIALALCAGQHHYLRDAWLPTSDATRAWLGGLVAGLAGGAAGQLLFLAAPGATGATLLFRVLGWTLLGALAGLFLAYFVPNLRSVRGILGGAVGGAAGALGYLAAVRVLSGFPASELGGRILGAVLLGFFLGLMLALAERMARKAWLEVAYGGGEMRSVNLGIEPVSIGSNARAATIYARGAAPVACRYWFIDGVVKCHDLASGSVAELSSGSSQHVGAVVVSVRTANSPTLAPASTPATVDAPASPPAPAMPVYRPMTPLPRTTPTPAPTPSVRPPVPTQRATSPSPVTSPPTPNSTSPDTCPGCGKPVSGLPGRRYCIVCDIYV